jgi:hypothetical protein
MGTKTMMALAVSLFAAGAHAAAPVVLQDVDCSLVKAGDIAQVVRKVGIDTGLKLPNDMAVRTEVHCTRDGSGKRFNYTVRAAIEKMVNDGEVQRWAVVASNTGYGTTTGSAALLREVRFTLRDVVRQEP